jgi:hypothetical protein
MLKADSAGKLVAAVAGTDFVAPAGLSAYVPTTRTITINGTTFDLSADRSWSIVSGVSSFNTRTGAITLSSSDVTTALGYTPVTNARTLTINGTTFDLSANRSWTIVAGLSSFNTRTGDITLLDTDVTGALGYTPVTNARTITINGTTFDLSANRTWVVDTSSVSTRVVQKFTATASQTTFTITGGYTVGMVDVFLNGVKLDNATEFTASNGSTVVLSSAAVVNDVVEVYKYGGQFIANNSLRQTTAFTATAGQTTFTVNYSVGFVDVFYNGAKLAAAEFTATNGTSIVLGTACVVNDIVEVVAYNYTVGAFTGVGGSGTTNYISKWTASGVLGNSTIQDNGTTITLGAALSGTSAILSGTLTVNNEGITINRGAGNGYLLFQTNGTDVGSIYSTTGGGIRLRNATSDVLTITSTGTATFAAASSGNTLTINGVAASFATRINGSSTAGSSYGLGIFAGTNSSDDSFRVHSFSGTEYFRVRGDGRVGIGTSSPGYLLDVINGSNPSLRVRNAALGGSATLLLETANDFTGTCQAYVRVLGSTGNGQSTLTFGTAGAISDATATERMRLNSSGNLLVGKTATGISTLGCEILGNGTAVFAFAVNNNEAVIFNNINTSTTYEIDFRTNAIERGKISVTDSGVSYLSNSDYRLKEDLKDFNGLEKLTNIKVYDFKFKDLNERRDGVIAHELQEVIPYAVSGEKDGKKFQSVDYSRIVPVLIKSIQEQQAQIEELKNLINGTK